MYLASAIPPIVRSALNRAGAAGITQPSTEFPGSTILATGQEELDSRAARSASPNAAGAAIRVSSRSESCRDGECL
jgi:hypothetical protein